MPIKGYILVYTISDAFKIEKILKKSDIEVTLVPTPREFSSDCGVSALFSCNSVECVKELLDDAKVEYHMEGVTLI